MNLAYDLLDSSNIFILIQNILQYLSVYQIL